MFKYGFFYKIRQNVSKTDLAEFKIHIKKLRSFSLIRFRFLDSHKIVAIVDQNPSLSDGGEGLIKFEPKA